jgi:hypothetical protein
MEAGGNALRIRRLLFGSLMHCRRIKELYLVGKVKKEVCKWYPWSG